jgi:UDP-N-acetylglucosamine transferase subunit ALG13
VILVIFGTERWPFPRLSTAADRLAEAYPSEDVIVQTGHHEPVPEHADVRPWLGFDEFERLITEARIVVTHAGSGSILTTLATGKVPVVMPRRVSLGEHVDDHQVELAERMAELGYCLLVESADDLLVTVGHYESASQEAGDLAAGRTSLASTLAGVLASYER